MRDVDKINEIISFGWFSMLPGENVYLGKDHTLHARVDGTVKFTRKKDNKSFVSIIPA